jgi:DeoR family fructose operon transcriptional repressor
MWVFEETKDRKQGASQLLEAERQITVIGLLKQKGSVNVFELSELCAASQNTIRRDLLKLEKDGMLRRTRGGAILSNSDSIELPDVLREDRDREEKLRIGLAASEMVQDGETIIVDSGTTTMQMIQHLRPRRNLTVITNSLTLGNILADYADIVSIITGGILRPVTRNLVGFPAESFLQHQINTVNAAFLGMGGVDAGQGFTNPNPFEVEVKRAMIGSARRVVVLLASSKVGYASPFPVCPLSAVHAIVTGRSLAAELAAAIREAGVELVLV